MGLERRTFLQQAGLALLTLGMREAGFAALRSNHWLASLEALAQTSQRKLAFLVGINEYPQNDNLSGCVTDVELQKELLITRFGFNPKDILTLTNQQATRENIETAFIEHLTEQAEADDVVVFHFSGYGAKVKMPKAMTETGANSDSSQPSYQLVNSLIPADGIIPTKGTPVANDLLLPTLFNLGRTLPTDKLTMVLDTSFAKAEQLLEGNLRVRSLLQVAERPSPEEIAFREKIQMRLGGVFSDQNPGIVLFAADGNQAATEVHWHNFSAGLFTYALTQYLWQVMPASKIQVTWQRATETVESFVGKQQQPKLIGKTNSLLTYYSIPLQLTGAEGVIKGVEKNGAIALQLLGLPPKVLDNYGVNSCLTVVAAQSESEESSTAETNTRLRIKAREGLNAKAQLEKKQDSSQTVQIGQLVQELVRVYPRDLGLNVALAADLERIERVDATSAFANISAVATATPAGENHADCVLGKLKPDSSAAAQKLDSKSAKDKEVASASYYTLFSVSGAVISKTEGKINEAVKGAISRLTPQFKALLAIKWLELTVNENSSRLAVEAALEAAGKPHQLIEQRATSRRTTSAKKAWEDLSVSITDTRRETALPRLTRGSSIRFRLVNEEEYPLYLLLLGIDADGKDITLSTPQMSKIVADQATLQDIAIAPKQQLTLPQANDTFNWKIVGVAGMAEIYLICSRQPFTNTLKAVEAKQSLKLEGQQILNISNSLEVVSALLQDLHAASDVSPEIIGSASEVYALDVNAWATLRFVYEVVEPESSLTSAI